MSGTDPSSGVARRAVKRWVAVLVVVDLLIALVAVLSFEPASSATEPCIPPSCGPRVITTGEQETGSTVPVTALELTDSTLPTTAAPSVASPRPTAPGRAETPGTDAPAPAPVPVDPQPPGPSACGGSLPKQGGGEWTCTFSDEFDGSSVDRSKWQVQDTQVGGYHSGAECFSDSPNNVAVESGVLSLTLRQEDEKFICKGGALTLHGTSYTSGMVTTFNRFAQTYGRFEIRAKASPSRIRGLQTSLWLWPTEPRRYGSKWPASGEIDIAELFSVYPDRAIPHVHYNGSKGDPYATNNDCLIGSIGDWHTYVVEWTSDSMTFIYDGNVCLVNRWLPSLPQQRPQPFDAPFIVSLTQALGIDNNAFWAGHTEIPATTQVDYVRVWQ